jgi:hypothetical protein
MVQWTKRPLNHCRACGYTWYPRGHNVSACCPRCGGPEVELALIGCLRALFYLVAAPWILAGLLVWEVLRGLWTLGGLLGWLFLRGLRALGVGVSITVHEATERSRPARSAVWEATRGWIAEIARRCFAGIAFGLSWIASAKDDLFAGEDRPVNPVALFVKLLLFTVCTTALIIITINLFK